MSKLNKLWGWDNNSVGVFSAIVVGIPEADRPEWLTATSATDLDLLYHDMHSAERLAAPVVERYADLNDPRELSATQRLKLGALIYLKYGRKWERMWTLNKIEYNPIENYNMLEEETPDITKTHGGTTTRGVSDDFELKVTTGTDTDVSTTRFDETVESTFGFQSSTAVPTGTGEVEGTTRTTGDSEHNKQTQTSEQTGTTDETLDYTDTETGTRTLERSGNIGVTTSQQMAQSEIELWKWNFYDDVMSDIDSILTLSVYNYNKYERL